MPEETRRQIGKYRIQAELGRGGFGVVYSAYDPTVGRPVAIKVLTALGDSQLLSRFKNEAAAAGNLRHKNIITIYDYGDDDGLPYIVMELLEGEDLNQIIAARKPMPLLQKVSIMLQVADGLRSAHRAGVVHRDVKPGNIRLLPDGTVKLMDFGIARLIAGSGVTRLTRQGHVIGTLYYMAPEQVLGEEVDALSDIFAYGSTYYELLTGKHPFQGLDPRSVFHKITAEDPEPVRNLVPDCPEALEKVVNRTLQKDRDLRYQSLRDVVVDTEPILIELRQERAESLVIEAKRLYSATDLEGAQAILSEVFDLDPANREARLLRETIQGQLLDRLIRPKVEALIKKADDALAARRSEEAIESFEAALRLDRDNKVVAEKLEDARRLLILRREVARLVADARRQFSKQDLEGALETLLKVLERDSSDPDAQHFLGEVRAALTRREKEKDYGEKIQRTKDLLQAKSFEEAAAQVENLDPEFQGREEVKTLAAQIRSEKEKFERQQQLTCEIAGVRELLAGAHFEAAIKQVEALMKTFPEEVEPTKLFILAHKELAAYRKAQALTKLENELNRLVASGHFERALSLISQSLETYPSEPRLVDSQRQIEEEWACRKREAAIRQVLEDSERCVARSEFEKAVQLLEAESRNYPEEDCLAKALALAREALASKLRDEAIASLIIEAQTELNKRQFRQALDTVDSGLTKHGGDERLSGIRERIVAAQAEWERAEAIRELVERSRELISRNEFEPALELLNSGLARFPGEPHLTKLLTATQDAQLAKLRDDEITNICAQAQTQLAERQYQLALEAIERGQATHGHDGRLAELREKIIAAKAAWERAEAIRQDVEEAQRSVSQQDFGKAIALVESALGRYPREPALIQALKSARSAQAAKRRDEAIESFCAQARTQTDKREFSNALKTIERGISHHGNDTRFLQLREQVALAKTDWERAEAVRTAVEGAQRSLAQGQPERALGTLESASARYANEPRLAEAKALAQEAIAAKHREQAITALGRQAQKHLEARAYQKALELLDQSSGEYGGDRRLADLRAKVISAKEAEERAAAVAKAVENSRGLIAQKEFERAIALVESALSDHPAEPQLTQALEAAREGLAAHQRDHTIEEACNTAQVQLDQSDFQGALAIVETAWSRHGADARLTAVRNRIITAEAAWKRAEAVRQVAENAHRALAREDFEEAVSSIESALKRYPGEAVLTEALASVRTAWEAKRRDDTIKALVSEAQTQVDKGDFSRALKIVDRGATEYGNDERLRVARKRVLSAQAVWERDEAIRHALENANTLVAQQEPRAAVQVLEGTLEKFPAEPPLTEALTVAREAVAAQERENAIEALLKEVRRELEAKEFVAATSALDRGTHQYGSDTRLTALRAEVEAARTNWERAQAIEAEARERIASGQPESAAELIASAGAQFGEEPQLQRAMIAAREAIDAKQRAQQREQSIDAVCESAQAFSDARDYGRALQTLDEASEALGQDARLADLRHQVATAKAEWERSDAIRAIVADARKHLTENDPANALQLLERALASYPDNAELLDVVADAHHALQAAAKETAITALSKQTQVFIGLQDFRTALETVEQGLKTHGPETRLSELRESILAAQAEWERMDALRQSVSQANHLLAQSAPEEAIRSIENALTRFPGDPLLLDALASARRVLDLKRRDQSIEKICAEGREELRQGRIDTALQQVEVALKENGEDYRLQELLESIRSAKAEAQRVSDEIDSVVQSAKNLSEQGKREEAIAVLERSLSEHPGNPELVAAIVGTIDAVGAAGTGAIDNICRDARQYMLTGNFNLAFHTLEQALQLQSDDEQSARQQVGLTSRPETAKAAASGSARLGDAGSIASVKEKTEELALPEIASKQGVDIPDITEHASTSAEISTPRLEHVAGVTSTLQPGAGRLLRNPWLIGAVAALLIAAFLVVMRITRAPKMALLHIRTSPTGATVRVNNQPCSAPPCEFQLRPGQYQVQVSAAGYEPVATNATVRGGDSDLSLFITLLPLSPTARVSANFAEGEATLDNQKPARMQDGQLRFEQLSPGRHSLRVSGREGTAAVSFDADYAKLPAITNVSQQDTEVLVATSFGNRVTVACSGCSGTVKVDDRSVGELKDGTITAENVGPGTHRVKVGEDRSLIFSTGSAPDINLIVNSNRNFGALVIEANEDNATVFIDGKKYPRLASRGQLSIPAEAKQHTIRVAKEGYRVDPPEIRAELKKGDQFEARFNLVALPARLIVSKQLPGAAVRIDGSLAGTVSPDGSFSAQVNPGDHQIEFMKDGYSSAKLQRSFGPGRQVVISRTDVTVVANAAPAPPAVVPPPPKPDPNAVEQADWQRIQGTQNVEQLEDFLRSHPAGIHREEAQARLKELRLQQAEAEREAAWNAVDKNNKGALQQFLTHYGEGSHAQDARTMIAAIDKQKRDELAASQQAKEQANRNAADSTAVVNTLRDFEVAYNQRSLESVQDLWAGMPKNIVESYRNQFRDARSLDFRLTPAGQAAVDGNTATVTCTRSLRFVAKNGQRPPERTDRVRVALERAGSKWVIRSITPF
jgi:eukaryotic-like serine/threonine-protein kinase